MSINQYYGETFYKLCEGKEMTVAEVVKKSGVPKSTMSKFVNGQAYLNVEQMDAVLEAIHVNLSEYDYYLNHFQQPYHEEYFARIDKAAVSADKETLQKIYKEADHFGERMIALCAKARSEGLNSEEVVEVSSFILGIENFTFYELVILSDTISQYSPELITSIIQDLKNHHRNLKNRSHYRTIMAQIACQAAATCVTQHYQKEALEALNFAETLCHEKDSYSRKLYRFTKGYYLAFYGQGKQHQDGLEDMKKVIEIFKWEGSEKLAQIYQKFYDTHITNAQLPAWLSDILK